MQVYPQGVKAKKAMRLVACQTLGLPKNKT